METIDSVLRRLRSEYIEMPGLRLTPEQVQRLCGIDRAVCEAVLDMLVAAQFLDVTANRTYARPTDNMTAVGRPRSASARITTGQYYALKAS
jgi:hypothetical protein